MQNNGPPANNREIERKFLLKRLPDKLKGSRCYIIDQGYLASESAGRQVRLRKKAKAATLTFKVGRGSHREEREVRLSPKQFAALWPGTAGRRLRKVPKIQAAVLVWTRSDWGKTLQQRATRQRVGRERYGLPFEVA